MPTAAEYEYIARFSEPSNPTGFNYIGSTHGRSTSSGDTPASTPIPPGLTPPGFQISLFEGTDPVIAPRGSIGSVVLRDPTGLLDVYVTYVLDGGIFELLRGLTTQNVSAFTRVAKFTTAGMAYGHDTKEIRLHDLNRILEASLLHENRYTGAGGAGGDATLKGVWKPYGIGTVFNISPVQINATAKIYQLTDSAMWAVAAVKEGGNALGYGTDRANYAAMAASAPAAGVYDTCFAEGLIRLGSSPTLPITVDFTGDTEPSVPYLLRGNIAKRIVTRAGTGVLTSGQVNSAALSALNSAKADDCGFYWDKEITKAAALTEVMSGCLGHWFVNLSGELVLGYLAAPTSPAATYQFGSQTGVPAMTESLRPPRWKTSVSFARNYTIMDRSQLAGAVTDADASILAQDAQWESDETAVTQAKYPTSFEKRVFSGLVNSADAASEAVVQQTLLSSPRERWRVPIYDDPFTLAGYLGQTIAIANCPRYSWGSSKSGVLVSVEWGADLIPTATLWC